MAEKKTDAAATTEEAPKKSKKMLIIIIAAVVLIGGGVGGFMMFGSKKSTAKPAPKPGVVVPLDAITINLADGHYLKIAMSLQMTAAAGTEALDGSQAQDLAIDEYSNRPMAELLTNASREKSKTELLTKVEKAYEDKIMDIYFTTFVIQ
jgi:flagellar protein FliL